MGELDIFATAPEKWFPYDDDTEVLIQYQGKEILTKISSKAGEIERKTGASAGVIANKLTGRAAVKGWRRKLDHDHPGLTTGGQPLPFTPANVDMLMTKSIDFSTFVNRKCIDSQAFRSEVDINIDALAAEIAGYDVNSPEAGYVSKNG